MRINRREAMAFGASSLAVLGIGAPAIAQGKVPAHGEVRGYEDLQVLARALSTAPFEPPRKLPERFARLSHDEYMAMRLAKGGKFWSDTDLPFRIAPFHGGWLFTRAVDLFEIKPDRTEAMTFDPARFDYPDGSPSPEEAAQLAYTGFRIFDRFDFERDMAAFLGASYFRAVGGDMQYGLSARGLAIDTSRFGEEEFPYFTAFWFERPKPGNAAMTVLALLDSGSTTGAYKFTIEPGGNTIFDVAATIYPRRTLNGIGIAPITSMYLYGENDYRSRDDFRPEVHDSDGLMMRTGAGEWIWRPLQNPSVPRVNSFQDTQPSGFGLVQRDRNFDHYLDDGVYYDRRPNLWIEPSGDWGKGRIELVELPAHDETVDNLAAYWRPEQVPDPDNPMSFSYRMHWGSVMPDRLPGPGRTIATRTGLGGIPGQERNGRIRKFVIDFKGGDLDRLSSDSPVEPVITAVGAEIIKPAARPLEELGAWRMEFDLDPIGQGSVDLRAFLRSHGGALTETWSYQWRENDDL
jgi:periplasmic glucans biosynthesis protein